MFDVLCLIVMMIGLKDSIFYRLFVILFFSKYKIFKLNLQNISDKMNLTGNVVHVWSLL